MVRSADGAVTSAAGALLLVELLGGTADRGALLGGLGAGAPRGELGLDHFVEELLFDLGAEDLVGELELADFFALQVVATVTFMAPAPTT
jgi:hypothetical protein